MHSVIAIVAIELQSILNSQKHEYFLNSFSFLLLLIPSSKQIIKCLKKALRNFMCKEKYTKSPKSTNATCLSSKTSSIYDLEKEITTFSPAKLRKDNAFK